MLHFKVLRILKLIVNITLYNYISMPNDKLLIMLSVHTSTINHMYMYYVDYDHIESLFYVVCLL